MNNRSAQLPGPRQPVRVLALVLAASLPGSAAQAAVHFNDNELPLGCRSGLMGGAGVAQGRDDGSLWLNPAGLAAIGATTLSLSLNAYGLESIVVEGYFTDLAAGPDEGWDGSGYSNRLLVVPASLAFFLELAGAAGEPWHQVLSVGLLSPIGRSLDLLASYRTLVPRETMIEERLTGASTRTMASLGYALELPGGLRAGLSLHADLSQQTLTFRRDIDSFLPEQWLQSSQSLWVTDRYRDLSLAAVLGVQWQAELLSLGAALRTPQLVVDYEGRVTVERMGSAGSASATSGEKESTTWALEDPLGDRGLTMAAGVALHPLAGLTIEADVSYYLAPADPLAVEYNRYGYLANPTALINVDEWISVETSYRSVFNAALGVELALGDQRLLAGAFTDRSKWVIPEEYSGRGWYFDRYGGSLGLGLGTSPWSATIGARYSYGSGDFTGNDLDLAANSIVTVPRPLVEHRLLLLLSGAVVLDAGGAP